MQIIVSCHFPADWSNSKCALIRHWTLRTHFGQLGLISTISQVTPLRNIKWICYSDCQLESACKDRLAEPHLGLLQKIFAVLDVWDRHVVLTLSFKLVSFFYIYICCFMVEDMDKAAATATMILLFCQTYLGITIRSTSAPRFFVIFQRILKFVACFSCKLA